MRTTIEELRKTAKSIESSLCENGCAVKVNPYFAYGRFSYLMNFKNGRFEDTHFGTKTETINNLYKKYFQVLSNKSLYTDKEV